MGLVFQYGSNASQARLLGPERLNGHGAVIGRAATVEDYDIAFDVWSTTNRCSAADLVRSLGRKAWGVLYEIADDFISGERSDGQRTLAQIEGPNYEERRITVRQADGDPVPAITFLVRSEKRAIGLFTRARYLCWVVSGLREQGVPEPYVQHVIEIALETNRGGGAPGEEQNKLILALQAGWGVYTRCS